MVGIVCVGVWMSVVVDAGEDEFVDTRLHEGVLRLDEHESCNVRGMGMGM